MIAVREVRMHAVADLRPYAATNPKKPLAARLRKGLVSSLKEWGFAGVAVVAPNADGSAEILDANTRYQELLDAGVEQIPCVVMDNLAGDPDDPEVRDKRTLFITTFDGSRKIFDHDAVIENLRQLAERGASVNKMQSLSGIDNLSRILEANKKAAKAASQKMAKASAAQHQSIVLYGPADDIEAIKELTKSIKLRLSASERVRIVLEQAADNLDWSDDTVTTILLATIARFQEMEE